MEQHVIERLAAQSDLQGIHDDEVKRQHITRVMHLRELDLLLDTMLQLPTMDTSFERAANRVGYLRRARGGIVFLLEPRSEEHTSELQSH